jgi:hypothetical protein
MQSRNARCLTGPHASCVCVCVCVCVGLSALIGPEGTPYEGGKFKFDIKFPAEYPFKPPKINFSTKVHGPGTRMHVVLCYNMAHAHDKYVHAVLLYNMPHAHDKYVHALNPNP